MKNLNVSLLSKMAFVGGALGLSMAQAAPAVNSPLPAPTEKSADLTSNNKSAATAASAPKKTGKSTEANFEDLLVQGKYHFSDEAVVTVEQDKILDALLGVRTDFKDRIEQSATRF